MHIVLQKDSLLSKEPSRVSSRSATLKIAGTRTTPRTVFHSMLTTTPQTMLILSLGMLSLSKLVLMSSTLPTQVAGRKLITSSVIGSQSSFSPLLIGSRLSLGQRVSILSSRQAQQLIMRICLAVSPLSTIIRGFSQSCT
jgi:hypothetical protein